MEVTSAAEPIADTSFSSAGIFEGFLAATSSETGPAATKFFVSSTLSIVDGVLAESGSRKKPMAVELSASSTIVFDNSILPLVLAMNDDVSPLNSSSNNSDVTLH